MLQSKSTYCTCGPTHMKCLSPQQIDKTLCEGKMWPHTIDNLEKDVALVHVHKVLACVVQPLCLESNEHLLSTAVKVS